MTEDVAEFKAIRDLLVKALVKATGDTDAAVREGPMTCAVRAANKRDRLAAALREMVWTHGMHGPCREHSCTQCRLAYHGAKAALKGTP